MVPKRNGRKAKPARKRAGRVRVRALKTTGLDSRAVAYRRLLLDPCNGPLVPPVGLGPSSGLLVRQKYLIPLTGAVLNAEATQADSFAAVFRPATGEVIYGLGANGLGGSNFYASATTYSLETGILTSARAYRAVAGCLKFVPTGALSSRSGVISIGYVPDEIDTSFSINPAGRLSYINNIRTMANRTIGNAGGMELPEVKWVPSGPEDLEFRSKNVTYNADTGSCIIAGTLLDGPTKSSSTTIALNGYLEATVVWEWIPDYSSGVVTTVQASSRSTLVEVLSTLGDIGRALTDHAYAAAMAGVQSMVRQGAMAAIAGVVSNAMAGPAMLTA